MPKTEEEKKAYYLEMTVDEYRARVQELLRQVEVLKGGKK